VVGALFLLERLKDALTWKRSSRTDALAPHSFIYAAVCIDHAEP
jgi:hypothetical protein